MMKRLLLTSLLVLSNSSSLSAMHPQQVAQVLSLASGLYMMYAGVTQPDWQLRRAFRAGGISGPIAAGTMKLIEMASETYWQTNFFTSTLLGKTVKILASAGAALGFCTYIGVYKHIAENDTRNRKWAYIKGLVCGCFFMLPFCSDL